MSNTIDTSTWSLEPKQESRFLHVGETKLPVYVRYFCSPHNSYALLYPVGRLDTAFWRSYIGACRAHSKFSPTQKAWVWSKLSLDKATSVNGTRPAPPIYTKEQKLALRDQRLQAAAAFEVELLELSKLENVPEETWASYQYPRHLNDAIFLGGPSSPEPTALQRIVVSRYWDKPSAIIGASVGTGKSRMAIDMLSARALAPDNSRLNNSARIILLVAPLSLHTNWCREFQKWKSPGVEWRVHRFSPTQAFWRDLELDAERMFDGPSLRTGGLVILCTHQALSRSTLVTQFKEHQYVPTAIIVDEVQRFFRNPENRAYKILAALRAPAHLFLGLSGTLTSKLEDWHAHETTLNASHWKDATYTDYQRLGDPNDYTNSGLYERGWGYERGIKEFHAFRIRASKIFVADKNYYLRDALPGLEQQELGDFADTRLSFGQLFDDHPDLVKQALELQKHHGKGGSWSSPQAMATTLLLRMQQIAATSEASLELLQQFVAEALDKDEPCVFWTLFRNEPAEELPGLVRYLTTIAPTVWIEGGMTEKDRWRAIDAFQEGTHRFLVAQVEAGGVGLNLTKASKCYFNSIPFSYQSVTQCIGRLHRMGQEQDVTSYFAMGSPIAAFSRQIYDKRLNLNDTIPSQITGLLEKYKITVDAPPNPVILPP